MATRTIQAFCKYTYSLTAKRNPQHTHTPWHTYFRTLKTTYTYIIYTYTVYTIHIWTGLHRVAAFFFKKKKQREKKKKVFKYKFCTCVLQFDKNTLWHIYTCICAIRTVLGCFLLLIPLLHFNFYLCAIRVNVQLMLHGHRHVYINFTINT